MYNWEWPQYAIAALYALSIVLTAAMHGRPKDGNHNVLATIVASAIGAWILYAGGFWS